MKKITLLALMCATLASFGQQTLTHSADQTLVAANTVACPTEPTNYQRTFDLATDFAITEDFFVTEVQFGVEISEVSGTVPVRLALIDNANVAEDLDGDGVPDFAVLEELFLGEAVAGVAEEGTVVSLVLPAPVTVPANGILLFEIAEAVDGIVFRIGSNQAGQTAPSFLFSDACGFGQVADFGFVNHYVMNVVGDTTLSVEDDNVFAENISLFPNPTTGDLNINFNRSFGNTEVNVINVNGQVVLSSQIEGIGNSTLATSKLANGVYFAQVASENGTATIKFIKN